MASPDLLTPAPTPDFQNIKRVVWDSIKKSGEGVVADVCHRDLACSTIMIGSFWRISSVAGILDALVESSENEGDYDCYSLDEHRFDQFSWLVASTSNGQQESLPDILTKAGFKPTQKVRNQKNQTVVTLWTCSVPDFIDRCASLGLLKIEE